MSSENTNTENTNTENKQNSISITQDDIFSIIFSVVLVTIGLFILYLGFTASKQPWGYILGVIPILISIIFALSDSFKLMLLFFGMAGGVFISPIIILSFIISLVYTRY